MTDRRAQAPGNEPKGKRHVGPLSLVQARIFSNYNTLFEPSLEGSCSGPARKIAGAEGSSRGRGEFGISREFLGTPALAGSRDIPSARLIAAASLWHSCASPGAVPSSVRLRRIFPGNFRLILPGGMLGLTYRVGRATGCLR